ncbi:MAG: B12-binding domain-containing radical SAM protein [Candidatus Omnitrophica bacterium]|nr:B12-binding domain-containing radical SAM protein [Candidatus Omnitrophota bacterium]
MNPKITLLLAPPFWPNLPPLSLIHLGGFLAKHGFTPEIVDLNNFYFNKADPQAKKQWFKSCNKTFENEMLELLKKDTDFTNSELFKKILESDIIGFSCYKSNFKAALFMAEIIKQQKRDIKIVFGGPEISWIYFKNNQSIPLKIKNMADFIVVGEGEMPLLELAQGKRKEKVICFRELEDLDGNNFVYAYGKLKPKLYPRKKTASIIVSRGCVRCCEFCSERLLYKKFRIRSVGDIIKEIDFHKKKGAENFIFHDSMLNSGLKFLDALCEAIIDNFKAVNWEAQMAVRVDMPDDLLGKIKKSGCYNIFIGLESGARNIISKMNKGFTKEQALEFFKKLKKAQLSFGISLIVGYPGETRAQFQESLDFIIQNKAFIPKIEQVNPFIYYPGTRADRRFDYRRRKGAFLKTQYYIEELKKHGFKMTKAFLNNLVE